MKSLNSLLQLLNLSSHSNPIISSLTTDSSAVKSGSLFCALKGSSMDGHDFIASALANGASAILCERALPDFPPDAQKIFVIPDLYHCLGRLADFFYDSPSKQIKLIGVTGTNGKTSTTHYLAQLLYLMGEKVAVIGTVGNGIWGHPLSESTHTTPEVLNLHRFLREYVDQGVKWVAMEVSSHALTQNRLDGIRFYAAVFTNLTQDHLDYHLTMQAYGAAKIKLFERPELKIAVLNIDDAFSQQIIKVIPLTTQCFFYNAQAQVKTQLLGAFNISNINAAIATLSAAQFPLVELQQRASLLQSVKGRMEGLRYPNAPLIVIDYAHTPDALAKAISALKEKVRKIWVVFGCGGDRDASKRPLMAKAAEALADHVIVTEDNSRTEAIESIFADIKVGFSAPEQVQFIADRTEAIAYALKAAAQNDIILLAGKGHETYLDKNRHKQHFDEREVVAALLKNKSLD